MRHLHTVVASAIISCASVLAFAWPAATQATGPGDVEPPSTEDTFDPDAAQVGPLLATSKLSARPKQPGVVDLEVTFKNPSEQEACEARIETLLYAQLFSEDSRGGPMPEVAWKQPETLKLGPKEVISKSYSLPRHLAWRVYRAQRALQKAEAKGTFLRRGVSYYAEVRRAPQPAEAAGS